MKISKPTRHLSLLLLVLCCSILFITPATFGQTTDEATANAPGRVRLVLPPALYAVPNVETNIYFDNVILTTNVHNYAFDVQVTRQNNGLHPAPAGYHQVGDTIYAWLKAKLATTADH